jgi:hypothetical protein
VDRSGDPPGVRRSQQLDTIASSPRPCRTGVVGGAAVAFDILDIT